MLADLSSAKDDAGRGTRDRFVAMAGDRDTLSSANSLGMSIYDSPGPSSAPCITQLE